MVNIKVGFVLPDFRGGGAEKVIISLANEIDLKEHIEVYFLVGVNNGPLHGELNKHIPIIELGSTSGFKNAINIKKVSNSINLTHVLGTLGMAHSVALSKILGNKAKCISRIGNTVSKDLERWHGLKRFAMYFYQNVLCFSDLIITQSKYMQKDLLATVPLLRLKQKIVQIYNPIDIKKISLKAIDHDIPDSLNNDIVTVGRLEWQKDTLTIIKAFSLYHKKHPSSKLHILGDGYCKRELQNKVIEYGISSHVLFHGFITNPYPYIKNSKAFVMASLYEGFSNAILEAVALRAKVIVSNCPGGNSEIINHSVNGRLFPVGDYLQLHNELENIDMFTPVFDGVDKYKLTHICDLYIEIFELV